MNYERTYACSVVMDATITAQGDSLTVRIDQYQFTLGLRLDGLDIVLMYNNTEMLRVTDVYLLPQVVLPENLGIGEVLFGGTVSLSEALLEQATVYFLVHQPTTSPLLQSLAYLYVSQYTIMLHFLVFSLLTGLALFGKNTRPLLDYMLGLFTGQAGMLLADLITFTMNLPSLSEVIIHFIKNMKSITFFIKAIAIFIAIILGVDLVTDSIRFIWNQVLRDKKIKEHVLGQASLKEKLESPFTWVLIGNFIADIAARYSIFTALTSEATAGNVLPVLTYGRYQFLLNTLFIITLRIPVLLILQLAIHSLMTKLGV